MRLREGMLIFSPLATLTLSVTPPPSGCKDWATPDQMKAHEEETPTGGPALKAGRTWGTCQSPVVQVLCKVH